MMNAEKSEEEPSLLMAQVCSIPHDSFHITGEHVDLNETRAQVNLGRKEDNHSWYLDTGASNHMTENATFFSELDTTVHGTVKFGDNSIVNYKRPRNHSIQVWQRRTPGTHLRLLYTETQK